MDESAASEVPANPLSGDLALYNMYMALLDGVLADPKIRGTLKDLELSPNTLHMAMTATAGKVLRAAPMEFAAYAEARRRVAQDPTLASARPASDQQFYAVAQASSVLTRVGVLMAVAALGMVLIGLASPLVRWTLWAGITLVGPAALTVGLAWISAREWFMTLQGVPSRGNPVLAGPREDLMDAIRYERFADHALALIATWREARFSHVYSVTSISGLSETYDGTYKVATSTAADLEGLLSRVDGASIGVAGPRGVGKSTLIRGYCDNAGIDNGADLRCMVSAPVDYNSQEFVLHLFAVFCRAVIRRYDGTAEFALVGALMSLLSPVRRRMLQMLGAAVIVAFVAGLLHWQKPISAAVRISQSWIFYTAIAFAGLSLANLVWATVKGSWRRAEDDSASGPRLAFVARQHLARVRYLQTYTSGWSATLGLQKAGSGQFSRQLARAEQKATYPELVGDFQGFARDVAGYLNLGGGRFFIGIDELDKIGRPDQAEKFLNEIKGIFGIPHVYFMVSVSDEALAAFERRGLPLRDTFDSSFDEIIQVGTLTYSETRRLLYRRVTGLTEPYVALCHCLAGGLARDIIRSARHVVRTSEAIADNGNQQPTLAGVCGALVREELRRKSRAVAQAASSVAGAQSQNLQDTLQSVVRGIAREQQALKMVEVVCQVVTGEPPSIAALRTDFAAYAYYCATLQDVFSDHLGASRMVRATSDGDDPGTFDALAGARHDFALDTQLAWQGVSQFREAWELKALPWPALA